MNSLVEQVKATQSDNTPEISPNEGTPPLANQGSTLQRRDPPLIARQADLNPEAQADSSQCQRKSRSSSSTTILYPVEKQDLSHDFMSVSLSPRRDSLDVASGCESDVDSDASVPAAKTRVRHFDRD